MPKRHPFEIAALLTLFCAMSTAAVAADAIFHRAINLGGPALTIDGHAWDAGAEAKSLRVDGKTFENQKVALKPPTDAARARMIRSSVWGNKVELELGGLPEGPLQCFLYVWEDNHDERFDVLLNGVPVLEGFHSGSAGMWKKLGPWPFEAIDGKLKLSARGGAANLSGLEIWTGDGAIPQLDESPASAPTPEQLTFFESKVRPVLVESCYECHSAKSEKIKGGLLLDSRAALRRGGDTGPAVKPGDPDASLIIEAVRHGDKDLAMPPKKKLPPEQIAALEEWVRMGAPDPRTDDTAAVVEKKSAIDWTKAREWWSLRPLASPPVPPVKNAAWPANEIDRFILARIEAAGLAPAPDAEKRTLLRRVTYDLTGLPPSPEELAAFLADESPDAYSKVVERLLASPHYGERWGRFWLDVVRYADTAGDNSDFPIPQMHRYRDWVISAFNRDLPYDQFVRFQIAGDLLPGATEAETRERLTATGYIANARRFGSRVTDYPQHLTIEDTIDNFSRAFLGLSVGCARCHDHKFDPITAQNYYGLYGIFQSTRYPWPGIELEQNQRDLVPLAKADEVAAFEKQKAQKKAELEAEVKRLEDEVKASSGDAKKDLEKKVAAAKEAVKKHSRTPPPYELLYAVAEGKKRGDARVQQKGDPAKPGPTVRRHFLTVLGGHELPANEEGSGRRQLADWLLDPANPLPARVMANRIWLHHFGKGIVPTPNDFGKQGKPPTHPELLDYLASRFVAGGWSTKAMHREILLSRTYRQAGTRSAAALEKDPNNDLLASYPRRRLDAEAIRDTLLLLGGELDPTPGGAHPFPPQPEWNFTQHRPFKAVYETKKRSVYLMQQRIQRHPYLAVFDGADPSTSTPVRAASTTPLQALFFLNDSEVHEQARRFAERLATSCADDAARIEQAYLRAFCRPPQLEETARAQDFLSAAREKLAAGGAAPETLDAGAWQALVRVLLRLNEFVYLD